MSNANVTTNSSIKKQRKVIVTGGRAVGKSAISIRFAEARFEDNYNPTIESKYSKTITLGNGKYKTDIVDTAGQDEYSIFQQQYALGVDGYVLVYSITNRQSFELIRTINEKILNSTGNEKIPRIIVGNKSDLGETNQRKISFEEGEKLARELDCPFVECSAKTNEHIDEVFIKLILVIEGEDWRKLDDKNSKAGSQRGSCFLM